MGQKPLWGLGFYWAWVAVVFYSDALDPSGSRSGDLIEEIWLWATWAHMLALFAIAIVASRGCDLRKRLFSRCLGAWGCALGTAAVPLIASVQGVASTPFLLIIAAAMGMASSWHVLQWAQIYGSVDARTLLLPSFLSFALGLGLYFIIVLFPTPLPTITAVLLPLFSWLSMGRCRPVRPEARTGEASDHASGEPLPMRPSELALCMVAVFVFALCGEMLRTLALHVAEASTNIMGQMYLIGGLAGLVVLVVYALVPTRSGTRRRISIPMMRLVLVVMAIAFLVAPFLGEFAAPIAYGIFGAGFWCFRALTWVLCLLVAQALQMSSIRAIGLLDGTFALAVVVSGQLNAGLAEAVRMGAAEMTTVSLIAVFACMLMAMAVLNGRGIRTVLGAAPQNTTAPRLGIDIDGEKTTDSPLRASRDAAPSNTPDGHPGDPVQTLFDACGLSPREREVASLLARGRSLPFIQEELYISAGTAQTHARHIYKKMGVHSRQELIDRVERAKLP